jgi:hypothetical protein
VDGESCRPQLGPSGPTPTPGRLRNCSINTPPPARLPTAAAWPPLHDTPSPSFPCLPPPAGPRGIAAILARCPEVMLCKPTTNDRWDRRAVELAAFLLRHGHCNVPEVRGSLLFRVVCWGGRVRGGSEGGHKGSSACCCHGAAAARMQLGAPPYTGKGSRPLACNLRRRRLGQPLMCPLAPPPEAPSVLLQASKHSTPLCPLEPSRTGLRTRSWVCG